MTISAYDSRLGLGTDQLRVAPAEETYVESSSYLVNYFALRTVRVVLGRVGNVFRFSAPALDILVDANEVSKGWEGFLALASTRPDAAWLTFDVGPLRKEEVLAALNAPEDEDWSEPIDESGSDD